MKAQLILGSQYFCFMGPCIILLFKICGDNESGLTLAIKKSIAHFFRLGSYWDFLSFFTLGVKSATGNKWTLMCESSLQFSGEKTKDVIWSIRTLSSTVLLELASFKQDVYHSSLFTFCSVFVRLSIPRTGNSTNAVADCYCRWKYFYSSPWWIFPFFFFFRSRVRIMR